MTQDASDLDDPLRSPKDRGKGSGVGSLDRCVRERDWSSAGLGVALGRTAPGTFVARRRLAAPWMALVAGSVDSAAFSIARRSTSHISGQTVTTMSRMAGGRDDWAVIAGFTVASFVAGATACGFVVACRGERPEAQTLGLLLVAEAAIIASAGAVLLSTAPGDRAGTAALLFLAFSMGLQNAASSRLLGDRVRTTHVTGVVTDVGDGLGRMALDALRLGSNRTIDHPARLVQSSSLLVGFALGALVGTALFIRLGAGCVLVISLFPAMAAVALSCAEVRR